MLVHYSLCDSSFATKPCKSDYSFIDSNLIPEIKTLDDFIHDIESGKPISGTIFRNSVRDSKHFLAQQIFGVDVDKNLNLEQATSMLDSLNIQYTLGYYTFSHTEEKPKFRLLFIIDGLVDCPVLAHKILDLLYRFFDQKTDKNAKDIARIWNGTNKKVFRGELRPICLMDFIDKLNFKVFSSNEKYQRYVLDISTIEKEICLKNGQTYNIYRIVQNSDNKSLSIPQEAKVPVTKHWDKDFLIENCQVFREFVSGTKLGHDVLRGLARSLYVMNGGQKLFKEVIESSSNYDENKVDIIAWCKKVAAKPQWIKDFSPYPADSQLTCSLIELENRRGRVVVTEEPKLSSLEEAEKLMESVINKILGKNDYKIHVLKAPPGIGKSRFFINRPGIVIGFPEHFLKDEQFETSALPPELKISSPNLKGIFSKEVDDYITSLHKLDLSAKVHETIKKLAKGDIVLSGQTPQDIVSANNYLKTLHLMKQNPYATVFTTHARVIKENWQHPIIVIDEDPMKSIFESHEAKIAELSTVAIKLNCTALADILTNSVEDEVRSTPPLNIDDKELYALAVQEKFTSHVIRFFSSNWYVIKDGIVYYWVDNRKYFCDSNQYIILDGSACPEIYQRPFGERLVWHELPDTKYAGTINQYTSRSCSMTGLNEYLKKLEIPTDDPTITFRCFKSQIPNSCPEIHFGATRGSNMYAGKNINVVGTYRYPPTYYLLLTKCLNLSITGFEMRYQNVSYNGREFLFYTYTDSNLQRIHLEMVEAELLQAVHRSRILRYDATVTVFSGFPLAQANYRY
jgi:hypothetical protein